MESAKLDRADGCCLVAEKSKRNRPPSSAIVIFIPVPSLISGPPGAGPGAGRGWVSTVCISVKLLFPFFGSFFDCFVYTFGTYTKFYRVLLRHKTTPPPRLALLGLNYSPVPAKTSTDFTREVGFDHSQKLRDKAFVNEQQTANKTRTNKTKTTPKKTNISCELSCHRLLSPVVVKNKRSRKGRIQRVRVRGT